MNTQLCCEGFSLVDEDALLSIEGGGYLSEIAKTAVSAVAGVCADKAIAKVVGTVAGSAIGGPAGIVVGLVVAGTVSYIWDNY